MKQPKGNRWDSFLWSLTSKEFYYFSVVFVFGVTWATARIWKAGWGELLAGLGILMLLWFCFMWRDVHDMRKKYYKVFSRFSLNFHPYFEGVIKAHQVFFDSIRQSNEEAQNKEGCAQLYGLCGAYIFVCLLADRPNYHSAARYEDVFKMFERAAIPAYAGEVRIYIGRVRDKFSATPILRDVLQRLMSDFSNEFASKMDNDLEKKIVEFCNSIRPDTFRCADDDEFSLWD